MGAEPIRLPPARRDPEYCELRGYHGPFKGRQAYDAFPGWEGMGECTTCGSCRHVPTEEARRLAVTGQQ